MIFTVLGSGTTVPDPDRGPAGFLLQVGGRAFLVDGGSGTVQRCARAGVDPRTLDGGFYSHRHPDHSADLVSLLFTMRVGPPQRRADYPIWAGEGFADHLERLRGVYGHWIEHGGGTVVTELSTTAPDRVDLGDLVVRTAPAAHSAGALHLRFEAGGRAIVFSGDTGPSDALVTLASGADLLVCECGGPIEGHLAPDEVAAIARAARPKEVWLTHLYPDVDPDAALGKVAATGVPTHRASDLDRWDGS